MLCTLYQKQRVIGFVITLHSTSQKLKIVQQLAELGMLEQFLVLKQGMWQWMDARIPPCACCDYFSCLSSTL
ncbi:hypothetical protein QN277_007641 [Acacia crassicarpa]|uniref:Uncharacterized protein n=1 Tax=Acacia crassicarpa TaxID=499986 RepID=A0AAE1MAP7_9FABA|nr:hypothetical protein QN277_007641 [Acacia crassicarpa]